MTPETAAPPDQPPTSRRHTTGSLRTARALYAAGWTPTQIVRYFDAHDDGEAPHLTTVRRWVIPGYAAEHNRAERQRYAARQANTVRPRADETDQERLVRIGLLLRSRGMPYPSIAVALDVFEGIQRDPATLRAILREAGAVPDRRRGRPLNGAARQPGGPR